MFGPQPLAAHYGLCWDASDFLINPICYLLFDLLSNASSTRDMCHPLVQNADSLQIHWAFLKLPPSKDTKNLCMFKICFILRQPTTLQEILEWKQLKIGRISLQLHFPCDHFLCEATDVGIVGEEGTFHYPSRFFWLL